MYIRNMEELKLLLQRKKFQHAGSVIITAMGNI